MTSLRAPRWILVALGLLGACYGDDKTSAESDAGQVDAAPLNDAAVDDRELRFPGLAVLKLREGSRGWVALLEKPIGIARLPAFPLRQLRWFHAGESAVQATFVPAEDVSLLDFTLHPSGEVTAVAAGPDSYRLLRFDAAGSLRETTLLLDPDAEQDPYFTGSGLGSHPDGKGYAPFATVDTARVAPLGESVAVVVRTRDVAAVAFRYDVEASGAMTRRFRTVVEPGNGQLFYRRISGSTSGTVDTFGQLDNMFHVFIDSDADGAGCTVGVAETELSTPRVVLAHGTLFSDNIRRRGQPPQTTEWGSVVTRLDAGDGHRVGSYYVDTPSLSELHGLRTLGDTTYVVGRLHPNDDDDSWNAFIVALDAATLKPRWFTPVDVDRGDVLFDLAPAGADRLLAVGSTRYVQNPSGFSISEAAPLAVFLGRDGTVGASVPVPAGPRHNELRSVVASGALLLLAGFDHGPATHTADGDLSLLTADGRVRTVRAPP